jgi:hypothetical protein
MPVNSAELHFLIPSPVPSLDQRHSFADWTVSPLCIPANRVSVSAIGHRIGFNINSPATGECFLGKRECSKRIFLHRLQILEEAKIS